MTSAFRCARRMGLLILGASLWVVGPAGALQLSLVGDERLNQFGTGLPGTPYNTAPGGVDYDQIGSSDPHPGELLVNGEVPSLNYHTTADPLTNITINFTPDLSFTLEAALTNATILPAGGTFVTLQLEYSSTADGQWDLEVVDPSDGTTVLRADLVAGSLNGNPVAALTARATFDLAAPPQNVTMQTFAFFQVDPSLTTSPYSSLFDDGLGGFDAALAPGSASDFEIGDLDGNFDWDDIVGAFDGSLPSLISSTAEANGSIFSVSSSNFVPTPEPSALPLLALGLAGAVWKLRRRGEAAH